MAYSLAKSRKEHYGVTQRESNPNRLGATRADDSTDYGFEWLEGGKNDSESRRREEFQMSKRENPAGWNAFGATMRDEFGKPFRDNEARTVKANLVASRHVDLGATGNTRREEVYGARVSRDFRESTKYEHTEEPQYDRNLKGQSSSRWGESLMPVQEEKYYPYAGSITDGMETPDGKPRRWTSVAADATLMSKWHAMFGQLRTKWAPSTGIDSKSVGSKYSDSHSASSGGKETHFWKRKRRLGIIIGIVAMVILVAILVPTLLLLTGGGEKTITVQYEYEAVLSNRDFRSEMANTSSEAFRDVEAEFCDELDANSNGTADFGYIGCAVTEIRNGSLIIRFVLIISIPSSRQQPTAEAVIIVVGLVLQTAEQTKGGFTISVVVVVTQTVISEDENPVRRKVNFNETCSSSSSSSRRNDRCITKHSECRDSVCSCPVGRFHQRGSDKCTQIDCGEIPTIDNGTVTPSGTTYGAELNITCNHGFEPSFNTTISCMAQGTWGDMPTCDLVVCDEFIKPNNSEIMEDTTNRTFMDTINIVCDYGYTLDSESSTVTCQADASWGESPTCLLILCQDLQTPDHAVITPNKTQYSYKENVTVECDNGYHLQDRGTINCLEDGTWVDLPMCTPVECNLFDLPYRTMSVSSQDTYYYSDTISLACDSGYDLEGDGTVTCQADSSWTALPSCKPIVCQTFVPPENADVEVNATGLNYDDTVSMKCDKGFTLVGEKSISCDVNGTWPQVECVQINCSIEFIPPENSIVISKHETESKLELDCIPGYSIVGNSTVACIDGETWSKSPSCQLKDCGPPEDVPNSTFMDLNVTTFNNTFYVTCSEGYVSSDELTVVCQSNGKWSTLPTCQIVSCGNVTIPDKAEIMESEGDAYDKTVTFKCYKGYDIIGESAVVCQLNGSWTNYPMCEIRDCGQVADIENGFVNNLSGTTVGSIAYVTCNDSFNIVGDRNVSCLTSGDWESFPVCQETECGDYDPPEHTNIGPNNTITCDIGYGIDADAVLECIGGNWSEISGCQPVQCSAFPNVSNANMIDNMEETYTFGDTVPVYCKSGFVIVGNQNATCGANKSWENVPSCNPIICKDLQVPTYSMLSPEKEMYLFNDTVNMSCHPGYILQGEEQHSCTADGSWVNISSCYPIECDLLDINNSINGQGNQDRYAFNQSVTISCESGYELEGNAIVNCLANGSWHDLPKCRPILCDELDLPENINKIPDANEYYFNDTVEIECENGYEIEGNEIITCQANGTWQNLPNCTPIKCDELDLPENINKIPDANEYYFNDTVEIECENGYEIEGNEIITCQANGTWQNLPNCTPIKCDELDLPENINKIPDANEYYFNDTVEIECENGYEIEGNEIITCQANGTWQNLPNCTPIKCDELDISENINKIPDANEYYFNDTVEVECENGYEIEGNEIITCQANGTWQNLPNCTPIKCDELDLPENINKIPDANEYYFNDTVEVECENGYEIEGNEIITCQANGTWQNLPNCTPIKCDELDISENINKIPDANEYYFNDTVEVECENGYEIEGNEIITCQANGTWQNLPNCTPIKCDELDLPENINKIPDANEYYFNATVEIECENGYEIEGNEIITCQANGTWQNLPNCTPIKCDELDISENINKIPDANEYYFNDTVEIECENGYEIEGNEIITCQANGTWQNLPNCTPIKCDELDLPENINKIPDANEYYFNATVEIECENGYEIEGNEIITCQANGTWQNLPNCTPIKCDELDISENINKIPDANEYYFNDTVEVECENGYEIEGNEIITCQANGTWQNLPNCTPIKCDELDLPENINKIPDANEYYFNATVEIECENGYEIEGNEIITCQANGTWQNLPNCTPIKCDELDLPENINKIPDANEYYFNDTVEIECENGYEIEGNEIITCQANGTWQNLPNCTPIKCDELDISENINKIPDANEYYFNDTVEVECENGYEIEGNEIITCQANGTWQNLPNCKPISCDELVLPENTYMTVDTNAYTFKENATLRCKSGYYIDGSDIFSCQANGSWPDIPECTPVKCNDPVLPDNAVIRSEQKDQYFFNETVALECEAGYILEVNSNSTNDTREVLTCGADGNWIGELICKSAGGCKDYQPTRETYYIKTNVTVPVNTSLPVTCIGGLGFTNDSVTSVTCGADGLWKGEPECTIPGEVIITADKYNLKDGENTTVVCEVTDNPDWQSIILAKSANHSEDSLSPIFGLFREDGSVWNETFEHGIHADISNNMDGVIVFLHLSPAKCEDGGLYTCAAIVGNRTNPIETKVASTNVSVICSDGCGEYEPNRETHIVMTNETVSVNQSLSVTCIEGLDFTNDSVTSVTCGADGLWKGEPECTIPGEVIITADKYNLKDGENTTVVCEVTDNPDWQSIIIAKSANQSEESLIPIFGLFREDGSVWNETFEHGIHIDISNNMDGVIVFLHLAPAKCEDGGLYTCAAIVGNRTNPIETKVASTNVSVICSDGCGEYVHPRETHFGVTNETVSFNQSLSVTCIDGLDFTNDSITSVTCGADGMWKGEPECTIPGTVSFTRPVYAFELGKTDIAVCEVRDNPGWQHVVVGKAASDGSDNNKVLVSFSRGTDSDIVIDETDTLDGTLVVNATGSDGGIDIKLYFSPSECDSEGVYTCAALVGEDLQTPIEYKQANTSVVIIIGSSKPTISAPGIVYLEQEAEVQCSAQIGRDEFGESTGSLFMMTNFGENGSIAMYNGTNTPEENGCFLVDTISVEIPTTNSSERDLWAKCLIRHTNDTETDLESERVNISIQTSFVSFENKSYVFNIGEKATLVCDVVNIQDWRRIEVRSDGGLAIALNGSDLSIETLDSHISLDPETYVTSEKTARLPIVFDPVQCSDLPGGVVGDIEYTCAVVTDGGTVKANTTVTFQKLPAEPQLNMSYQIIEGQDSWLERLFSCDGEVGNPPGHIEVESDYGGEFNTLLSSESNDTWYGVITDDAVNEGECGHYQTVRFGLRNITTDYMHLKNLRCVTKPSSSIKYGETLYSEQKAIKIVPENYCEDRETGVSTFKDHPYVCNRAVVCPGDGSVFAVTEIECDECVDVSTSLCTSCSSSAATDCKAKGVQCVKISMSAYEGSSVTFTCNIQDYGDVSQVSVNDSSDIEIVDIDEPIEVFPGTTVTVTDNNVLLTFANVSCDLEGNYDITLNNETDVDLSLVVLSDPGTPAVSVPTIIEANQNTEMICNGPVGRSEDGKNMSAIYLSVMFEDSDEYVLYDDSGNRQLTEENCDISETVIYNIITDVSWNNSYVRCVSKNETAVLSYSAMEGVLLLVPELFCQPLQYTTDIGGTATFVCALKDISTFTRIVVSENITELIDENNVTLPFDQSYEEHVTLMVTDTELRLGFLNVTCEQEGDYQIEINDDLSSYVSLRIATAATEPSLNMPPNGRVYEQYEISCTGDVGRNEDGCASSLYLEINRASDTDFFEYEEDIIRDPAMPNNCRCTETVRLILFPEASWNNTEVRCVSRNETDLIVLSASQTIQLDAPHTYFETTEMIGVVGEFGNLTCIVANIPDLSDITIYSGANKSVIASYLSGANVPDVNVIYEASFINTSASVGALKVNVKFNCEDDGMYYCQPAGSGTTTTEAVTSVHLQRKPNAPSLTLSREIIENKYTLGDRLFYCEGDLGDPAGTIEIQSDFNGDLETFLSPQTGYRNNSIGWIINDEKETSNCKNATNISFAFYNITMHMQNKRLRCVIHPSEELIVSPEDVYDEKIINVIPDDYCLDKSGLIPHPYVCYLRVDCNVDTDAINGVPSGCEEDECYNDLNVCVDCSEIGGCNITGPTTTTTTTTTTPSPESSHLSSQDLLNGSYGENAEVTCTFNNINIDFSNLTGAPVIVTKDSGHSVIFDSSQDNLSDSNAFVTSDGVQIRVETNTVTLRFMPLECQHVGKYTFTYSELETTSVVDITANASTPIISKNPESFYRNQGVSVICSGDVGRPERNLVLQSLEAGDDTWLDISDVTKAESDTNICTTEITVTYSFFVDDNDAGKQYRCQSTGDNGQELTSEIMTVEIASAVIYFTEVSLTAEIGESLEIQCVFEGAATELVISRNSLIQGEESLCNVTNTGTVTCGSSRMTGTATVHDSNITTTLTLDPVECEDEGSYFCSPVSDSSAQALMTFSPTKTPTADPMLSIPIRTVLDYTEYEAPVACTANVGYPAGMLQIEYSTDNFTSYNTFSLGTEEPEVVEIDGCSVNKTVAFKVLTFDQTWNNTDLRCAVYYSEDETIPTKLSEIKTIRLIENVCTVNENNLRYVYHPGNCHQYIYCNGIHPLISECPASCPDIQNGTLLGCAGDCASLGC